jgi:DNA repair protein RadA/Sms
VRAGSLILLGGGPGLGKSTLLLQLAGLLATAPSWQPDPDAPLASVGYSVLYVSGEESEDQIADRATRLAISEAGDVDVLCASDMHTILEHLHARRPKAAIIDSVQTLAMADVVGANGSINQVRECAKALVAVCKQTLGIPIFLASHVTKGGDIAGPKTLEHIVDTTLYLEGEEGQPCRILRASKNRSASLAANARIERRAFPTTLLSFVSLPDGLKLRRMPAFNGP